MLGPKALNNEITLVTLCTMHFNITQSAFCSHAVFMCFICSSQDNKKVIYLKSFDFPLLWRRSVLSVDVNLILTYFLTKRYGKKR
jgi:hypothetical protein